MGKLDGKVAVVTGASRGIGKAVALAFAREGAALALVGRRDEHALRSVEQEVLSLGADALSALLDVGDGGQLEGFVQAVVERWKHLDILVNNAGILKLAPFEDISKSQWDETVRVQLTGTFNGCKAAVPVMKRQRSGKIINVTGPAALRPSSGVCDYAAAKGGIIALTSNMANELQPFNVQINCISPIADTRMTEAIAAFRGTRQNSEAPPPMPPEIVTPAFIFFACGDSDYITGQVLAFNRK